MTVKETLTTAKELLQTSGWAKGDLIKDDGCLCALGAVGLAVGHEAAIRSDDYDIFDEDPKASAAVKALTDQIPVESLKRLYLDAESADYSYVHEFNDWSETREEDVLALFDKAIQAQGE
ncbi:hypothetical protein PBI_WAITS_48 [Gordonia phage Waits]|uniref:Uncharacterized protein n=1 Tax=Gordonia phage Waits TaxID=2108120 RepID=A0A2P1JSG1_9CAUD|nr:hypothetical protein FDJ48_gp062 [Gordonia phage Waits]AVO22078.1 hypothetical protein PBI_WAITS_48 [Gordonia phage Waits]